jgi:hypothetical protein
MEIRDGSGKGKASNLINSVIQTPAMIKQAFREK